LYGVLHRCRRIQFSQELRICERANSGIYRALIIETLLEGAEHENIKEIHNTEISQSLKKGKLAYPAAPSQHVIHKNPISRNR
jgi:hypothetical protein